MSQSRFRDLEGKSLSLMAWSRVNRAELMSNTEVRSDPSSYLPPIFSANHGGWIAALLRRVGKCFVKVRFLFTLEVQYLLLFRYHRHCHLQAQTKHCCLMRDLWSRKQYIEFVVFKIQDALCNAIVETKHSKGSSSDAMPAHVCELEGFDERDD